MTASIRCPAAALAGALLLFLPVLVRAQGNVYLASSFFRQKKYEKVLKVLETIEEPGPRLLFYRAESLAALDRRPEAVAAYERLIERFPGHPDAYDARRKVLLLLDQDKNYPALVEAIQRFRDRDPLVRLPYNRLEADAHFQAGHHDEAIQLLESSDDVGDQRTLAEILKELGRVEAYLAESPVPEEDAAANRRRGLLLEHLRLPVQAVRHYRRVVAADPGDRVTLSRLATQLEATGRVEEALRVYRRLVELEPDEVKHGARLGRLLWQRGEQEAAREQWRRLLEENGEDDQRVRLVVRLFLEHEDPASALEVIERARRTASRKDVLLEEEESAHLMNRDPRRAARVWTRVLLDVGEPGFAQVDPRERILELAGRGGSFERAVVEAAEEAIAEFPRFVEYYLLTDELLRRLGREEEIPALMERLVEAVDRDPGTLRDHASRFAGQGRHLEASILYLAAHDALPLGRRWVVALEAAEELRHQGRTEEALALLVPFQDAAAEAEGRREGAGPAGPLPPAPLLYRAVDLQGGILLEDLRRNTEARRHFTRWIPRVPPSSRWVVPWVILAARSAAAQGDFPAAQTALEALVERGGNQEHTSEIAYRLGRLQLFAGKLEEARQGLREVSERFPDSELSNDALREVAWLLVHREAGEDELRRFLALRHLVEAGRYEDFRSAEGTRPEEEIPLSLRDDMRWLEARVLTAERRLELLVDLLEAGLEESPGSPRAPSFRWRQAEVLEGLGRFREAAAAWQEYLLENPESLRLEEVRERLSRLRQRGHEAPVPPEGGPPVDAPDPDASVGGSTGASADSTAPATGP